MIKITATGKYSLPLSASLNGTFLYLLKRALIDLENEVMHKPLNNLTVDTRIFRALVDEIFCKYHTQLSIINRDGKLLLTVAQAHALWQLAQYYDQEAFLNPEMGNLLLELHKKLS